MRIYKKVVKFYKNTPKLYKKVVKFYKIEVNNGVRVVVKEALLGIIKVHGTHYLNPEPLLQTNTYIGLYDIGVKERYIKNEPKEPVTYNEACYVYDSFVSFLKNNKASRFGALGQLFLDVKRTLLPTLELLRQEDLDTYYVPVIGRRIIEIVVNQWRTEAEDLAYKNTELVNKSK